MKKRMFFKFFATGMIFVLFSCFQCEPYFNSFLNIRNVSSEQIYFMAYKNGEPRCNTLRVGDETNYWEEGNTKSFLSIIAPYDSCVVRKNCEHGEILRVWRKNYPIHSSEKEFFREDDWELIKGIEEWNFTFTIDDRDFQNSTSK
jgi:hypothetical protein